MPERLRSFRRQRGSRGNIYRLRHDFAGAGDDNPASLHGAGSIEDAPRWPRSHLSVPLLFCFMIVLAPSVTVLLLVVPLLVGFTPISSALAAPRSCNAFFVSGVSKQLG